MSLVDNCPLADLLAVRLREARDALTGRWLDRISARVSVDPNKIFPTDELLDHVPILIDGVATYVADPAVVVSSDMAVVAKARELGALRHAQGFDQYQILKEFEILGGILLTFVGEVADESGVQCSRGELIACAQRVFHAVCLIQQATFTQFLQLVSDKVAEREDRLRAFNMALTHEFRNRIGASLGAGLILEMPRLDDEQREQLAAVVVRNVRGMQGVLDNLLELSVVDTDARQHRHVRLPRAAAEVGRELREMASAAGVDLKIVDLPDVEVAAAAVELCLTNLVSNAIKYCDPSITDRWIEVTGSVVKLLSGEGEVILKVADNGIGVRPEHRDRLFERFFRAIQGEREIEGTGIGLSIVRETVASLGGRVWAEFPEKGSVFAFALPIRRESELASAES
jgi:signal transduction histidine kinase